MITNFKEEIEATKKAENHFKTEIPRLFSYLNKDTIKYFQRYSEIKTKTVQAFLNLMERIYSLKNL